jgi:hypothetical protein
MKSIVSAVLRNRNHPAVRKISSYVPDDFIKGGMQLGFMHEFERMIDNSVISSSLVLDSFNINVKVGDFAVFAYNFCTSVRNCTSVVEFMNQVIVTLSMLMKTTPLEMFKSAGKYCILIFIQLFGDSILGMAQTEFYVKSINNAQGFIKQVRNNMFKVTDKLSSEFANKLSTFLGAVLTLPFALKHNIGVEYFGYHKGAILKMRRDREHQHSLPFAIKTLDSFLYIFDRLLDCVKYGSIDRLAYDDDMILLYHEHYKWHSFYADKLDLVCNFYYVDVETGVKSSQRFTTKSYMTNIEKLIVTNKAISASTQDKVLKAQLKVELGVLERAKLKVMLKLELNRTRDAPLALAIIGSPGIGKTQIVDKFLKMKCDIDKELGRDPSGYDPSRVYHHNGRDKYMSEFSSSDRSIVIDDVGQFRDEIILAQQGGAMSYLIDFINDNALVTEQADLENKGKIYFYCSEVVITSNFADCKFSTVFPKGGGIYRRFLFVFCRVKEEFQVEGETRLKGDLKDPNNFDMHEFMFKRYKNLNGVDSEVYWNGTDWQSDNDVPWMSIFEVGPFLRDEILIPRYEQQDRAKAAGKYFLESESCSGCKLTKLICSCPKAQTDYESDDDFDHTPEESGFDSDVTYFLGPESWFDYFTRCNSLLSMYLLWIFYSGWKKFNSDGINILLAMRGLNSFNSTTSDHDILNETSFLSRQRIRFGDYFVNEVEAISNKDVLQVILTNRRRVIYAEFGLTILIATLTALVTSYLMFSSFSTPAEAQATQDDDDEVQGDDEDDYWKVQYEDMTVLSGEPSTTTFDQLTKVCERNIMMLKVQANGKHFYVNAFGLYGNVAAIPKHAYYQMEMHDFECNITAYRHDKSHPSGASIRCIKLDKTSFTLTKIETDCIIVQSPSFGVFRDIRKFLLEKDNFAGKTQGKIVGRNLEGEIVHFDIDAFQRGLVNYKHITTDTIFDFVGYKAYARRETFLGLCGAPYILKTMNGCFIGGFHVALRKGFRGFEVFCCPLSKEIVDCDVKNLVPNSYNGLDLNEVYKTDQNLALAQSTHPKCPTRKLDKGSSLKFYGNLDIFRPKLKTSVGRTIYCREVLNYFNMDEVEYFSPKKVNSRLCTLQTVNKMCSKSTFAPSDIKSMTNSLLKIYINVVDENKIKVNPQLHSVNAAINGLDGAPYINRLPVKTSGGFAHKGPKKKYFILGAASEENMVNYDLVDDVAEELTRAYERIAKGERISAIWDFTFKDEPITQEKVDANKCRIFNSASLFFSILERQAFLWCIPLFSGRFRHKFGCAIGANACGKDWTVLYNHIVKYGVDRIIAGDYSSFDKRMEPAIVMAAFEVLIGLAEHLGFSEEDRKFMTAVATEVAYPISNIFGTVVEFYGTNPSGHSLTTIINSIVNCLYMMLACNHVAREEGMDVNFDNFFDFFSLLTYGDDNIASSSIDAFNHVSISRALACYRVVYTMADKESESVPFINIMEASFLKRYFVRREDKFMRAPLEEKSIKKMLTVCTRSRTISLDEQCAEIIDSACREYFQYGRRTFNKRRAFLTKLLDKRNLWGYLNRENLPTYDELKFMCYGDEAVAQSEMIDIPIREETTVPFIFRFLFLVIVLVLGYFRAVLPEFKRIIFYFYRCFYMGSHPEYGARFRQVCQDALTTKYFIQNNPELIDDLRIPLIKKIDLEHYEWVVSNKIYSHDPRQTPPWCSVYVQHSSMLREIERYQFQAVAQSEMVPDHILRAQSAPEIHNNSDSESESDISEFLSDFDDSYEDYIQWSDRFSGDRLVDESEEPECRDGANIYDNCVLFTSCFCIARYGTLYRELTCTRCHCEYGSNCDSAECNKENISVTQA